MRHHTHASIHTFIDTRASLHTNLSTSQGVCTFPYILYMCIYTHTSTRTRISTQVCQHMCVAFSHRHMATQPWLHACPRTCLCTCTPVCTCTWLHGHTFTIMPTYMPKRMSAHTITHSEEMIMTATERGRSVGATAVVGFGGGSPMDAAKIVRPTYQLL